MFDRCNGLSARETSRILEVLSFKVTKKISGGKLLTLKVWCKSMVGYCGSLEVWNQIVQRPCYRLVLR